MRPRKPIRKVAVPALLVVAAFLLLFSGGRPVHAAPITVNSAADVIADDGVCTLREAITAANTDTALGATPGECPAGSGADTITVPAGTYTLSIPGADEDANASGDLDITADLTINGAGAAATIIDGAALDRVFHIAGVTVEISGATIQNGLSYGGGIFNGGTLTLNDSTVSGNTSAVGGGMLNGSNSGATLTNVTFSGNTAQYGGGMDNGGVSTLTNVTFSGNSSPFWGGGRGGGMRNYYGSIATLTNVTFSGNSSANYGGGMYNGSSGTTLTNVTFSGNSSRWGGGMLNSSGIGATLTNVTFSGNTAQYGGGIYGGVSTLTNVTFSGNTAQYGGGIYGGVSTLKNTIVANNSPNDCAGSITSAGHNLSSDASCGFTAPGDLQNADPLLGLLADNGGLTQTHALLAGSPAIDAGSPDCPPPATDQRGVARPQGAACDIGAFELVSDSDGDGIPDSLDSCPLEDSRGFDADNNGCIDRISDLHSLFDTLYTEGAIDGTMYNSLNAKIDAAVAARTRENICAAVNVLGALKNQVEAQRGKKVSEEAAALLFPFITNVQNYMLIATGVNSCS